jgi:hypothetical protein
MHFPIRTGRDARRPCNRSFTVAALVLLTAAISGRADDPPGTSALFDGRTLDGWKKVEPPRAGEVKASGGVISLGAGEPFTGVVCTRNDLPVVDYELTYTARRTAGDDFFAAATFPVGPSYLTLVNGGWGGSVTGLSSINGADASENETNRFVKYRNGTWYRFRVRVTRSSIRCQVDDKEIIAIDYEGQQLKTRLEVRGCQPLGFASWRSSGEVRDIAIRPLRPED